MTKSGLVKCQMYMYCTGEQYHDSKGVRSYVRRTDNVMCSSVEGWKLWASLDRIQKKNMSYFAPMGITPLEPTPTGM